MPRRISSSLFDVPRKRGYGRFPPRPIGLSIERERRRPAEYYLQPLNFHAWASSSDDEVVVVEPAKKIRTSKTSADQVHAKLTDHESNDADSSRPGAALVDDSLLMLVDDAPGDAAEVTHTPDRKKDIVEAESTEKMSTASSSVLALPDTAEEPSLTREYWQARCPDITVSDRLLEMQREWLARGGVPSCDESLPMDYCDQGCEEDPFGGTQDSLSLSMSQLVERDLE